MLDVGLINFYFGEVIDNGASTYKRKDDNSDVNELFTIDVKIVQHNNEKIINCKPASNNSKQIPIKGENVLIFQGYDHTTSFAKKRRQWYYLTPIGIQSSINSNILPTTSDTFLADNTVPERVISSLQPFKGDILYEGRWGNSIRLGSTISTTDSYDQKPSWAGKKAGDPIIVISNSPESTTGKQFIIEDVKQDASSIYLTSKQNIPTLLLGESNKPNPLTCFLPSESQFDSSQCIAVADRIVLKAKTDIAVIDSPKAIVLNTTGEIKLGADDANESMVHGDELLSILQKIINQLNSPILCGTMVGTFIDKSNAVSAQTQLQKLLSSKYFIKKQSY
jgi:hypothetical protein